MNRAEIDELTDSIWAQLGFPNTSGGMLAEVEEGFDLAANNTDDIDELENFMKNYLTEMRQELVHVMRAVERAAETWRIDHPDETQQEPKN